MTTTINLKFPEIADSQSGKATTHNEALHMLDALVNCGVIDRHLTAPPGSPVDGDVYIPAATATGAWAGKENNLAQWDVTFWKFHVPEEGWTCYVRDEDALFAYTGSAWTPVTGSVTSAPFTDTTAIVKGSADATKLARFEVDGLTTGTTRVLTVANRDYTIAGTDELLVDFTAAKSIATPNATVPVVSLTATSAETNIDAALVAKGTGAITAQVANNAASGGNKRGANAVDWSHNRSAAAMVASGAASTIAGGINNKASNTSSTVGGGDTNEATGAESVISGGSNNIASASNASVGGGIINDASGQYTHIGGGYGNQANGDYSTVPGGQQATTRGIQGRLAMAAGQFGTKGDAQWGKYVIRRSTPDATPLVLTSSGGAASATNGVVLPNNSTYTFKGLVSARDTATGDSSGWEFVGVIKRGANAAATALVAAVTPALIAQDAGAATWVLAVTADTTNGGLSVTVTGVAATTIRWVATIDTVEVTN